MQSALDILFWLQMFFSAYFWLNSTFSKTCDSSSRLFLSLVLNSFAKFVRVLFLSLRVANTFVIFLVGTFWKTKTHFFLLRLNWFSWNVGQFNLKWISVCSFWLFMDKKSLFILPNILSHSHNSAFFYFSIKMKTFLLRCHFKFTLLVLYITIKFWK